MEASPEPEPRWSKTPTPTTSVKSETPETTEAKEVPSATASLSSVPSTPSVPPAITIPSYSRWFSWGEVHDTERRILPEFFDGKSPSKNPNVYKYYRDTIIRRFWESPARRITFTEARRGLVGDIGSVQRVFDFLESWGLINYTPSSKQSSTKGVEEKKGAEGGPERKESPSKKICTGCGAVCSQACFAPDKQAEVILCARCFVRGNYRAGLTSGDFKRVDIGEGGSALIKSEWADKETLHLLEAVLHYGDEWKKVAQHVGNGRSERDCVVRFIKLPFGEQFRGDSEIGGENAGELPLSKWMRLSPLADTSNPIMAQVAVLSAMVGSDVAEAAAQAAVRALSKVDVTGFNGVNDRANEAIANMEKEELACENGHANENAFEEAVAKARLQLKEDQDEVERSVSKVVDIQMKEMQEKITHFEELELLMEKECSQLQHMKSLLFADQLGLLQQNTPINIQ